MRLLGAETVADLGPRFVSAAPGANGGCASRGVANKLLTYVSVGQVNTRMIERDIYDGEAGLDGHRLGGRVGSKL